MTLIAKTKAEEELLCLPVVLQNAFFFGLLFRM
jgi:hypothetical protein